MARRCGPLSLSLLSLPLSARLGLASAAMPFCHVVTARGAISISILIRPPSSSPQEPGPGPGSGPSGRDHRQGEGVGRVGRVGFGWGSSAVVEGGWGGGFHCCLVCASLCLLPFPSLPPPSIFAVSSRVGHPTPAAAQQLNAGSCRWCWGLLPGRGKPGAALGPAAAWGLGSGLAGPLRSPSGQPKHVPHATASCSEYPWHRRWGWPVPGGCVLFSAYRVSEPPLPFLPQTDPPLSRFPLPEDEGGHAGSISTAAGRCSVRRRRYLSGLALVCASGCREGGECCVAWCVLAFSIQQQQHHLNHR